MTRAQPILFEHEEPNLVLAVDNIESTTILGSNVESENYQAKIKQAQAANQKLNPPHQAKQQDKPKAQQGKGNNAAKKKDAGKKPEVSYIETQLAKIKNPHEIEEAKPSGFHVAYVDKGGPRKTMTAGEIIHHDLEKLHDHHRKSQEHESHLHQQHDSHKQHEGHPHDPHKEHEGHPHDPHKQHEGHPHEKHDPHKEHGKISGDRHANFGGLDNESVQRQSHLEGKAQDPKHKSIKPELQKSTMRTGLGKSNQGDKKELAKTPQTAEKGHPKAPQNAINDPARLLQSATKDHPKTPVSVEKDHAKAPQSTTKDHVIPQQSAEKDLPKPPLSEQKKSPKEPISAQKMALKAPLSAQKEPPKEPISAQMEPLKPHPSVQKEPPKEPISAQKEPPKPSQSDTKEMPAVKPPQNVAKQEPLKSKGAQPRKLGIQDDSTTSLADPKKVQTQAKSKGKDGGFNLKPLSDETTTTTTESTQDGNIYDLASLLNQPKDGNQNQSRDPPGPGNNKKGGPDFGSNLLGDKRKFSNEPKGGFREPQVGNVANNNNNRRSFDEEKNGNNVRVSKSERLIQQVLLSRETDFIRAGFLKAQEQRVNHWPPPLHCVSNSTSKNTRNYLDGIGLLL